MAAPPARHMAEILKDHPALEVKLIELLNHKSQLVVAYSLLALEMMDSPAVGSLPTALLERKEKITLMMGSFADKNGAGSLCKENQEEMAWKTFSHELKCTSLLKT
jgi:hypothetical protein